MRRDLLHASECLFVQRKRVILLVSAVLLLASSAAAIGAANASASGDAGVPAGGFEQMDIDADDVLIEVSVDSNGDAVWEIQYRIRLATDDEEQAFEELRDDIDSDPEAYTDRFRARMVATADAAEAATGREMEIAETTVSAERRELPQSYGVVTYRFHWSGFAAVDGDRVVVGDAIDGLFLDEASSLIVSWPNGYELVDAVPSPTETRDGAVVWTGPVDFTGGEPRITAAPKGLAVGPLALLVVGLLVLGGGAVAYRRRRDGSAAQARVGDDEGLGTPGDSAAEPSEAAQSTGGVAATTADATDSAETSEPGGAAEPGARDDEPRSDGDEPSDAAAGSDATDETDETDDAAAPPVDETLLSNEEQVLRLIESNGGRMKQKRVAEELDWTAAKTSQVVTGLRDDDELDGFRLGRENVLSLPDYDAGAGGGGAVEEDGENADGE